MKANTVEARIRSIIENEFSINLERLSETSDKSKFRIGFLMDFEYDKNEKTFEVHSILTGFWVENDNKKEIAHLSFSFVVEIKNIEQFIVEDEQEENLKLPDDFLKSIVFDVYATGRVMINDKLSGTILKDEFLPLRGAERLFQSLKDTPINTQ